MSSREEREVIRLNFAELTKNLNPMEIIDDMQVHKLLTLNEHSDVETKTKQSRRDGVSHLLKALQRRKPGSLRVFIELLKKVDGSEFLAEKLEADLNRGGCELGSGDVRACVCAYVAYYQDGCNGHNPLSCVPSVQAQC